MAVGIRELDGNLAAGPPSALKLDRDVVLLEMLAHPQELLEVFHLKRQVVELDVLGTVGHRANQTNPVMIFAEAHEHHAAGDHVGLVDVRNLEPEDLRVELYGALEITTAKDDV